MTLARRRILTAVLTGALGAGVLLSPATVATAAPKPSCRSGVPGDVNGDGHAEVAVTEAGRSLNHGAVHVFYGRALGLTANASGTALDDQFFDADIPGLPDPLENRHDFGASTAFGDFNADGCADLAVGAPSGHDVLVLYGSPKGLSTSGVQQLSYESLFPNRPDPENNSGNLGGSVITGELNGDGVDDLALGAPGAYVAGRIDAGAVGVVFGSAAGLDGGATPAALLTRDTVGVPGAAAENDNFGYRLAVGDFDGDGVDALAIQILGVGRSDSGSGAVQIVERGTTGYGDPQPQPITPAHIALPNGDSEWVFGEAMAAGDANHDGRDELAIGIPRLFCEQCGNQRIDGAVAILSGSAAGVTTVGHRLWTQASPGVGGTPGAGDQFGFALAFGALDRDGYADLAVGAPGDSIGSKQDVGSVTVLRGSAAGLTTAGSGGTRISQATSGVAGTPETSDLFGISLVASYVQSKTAASLVVGAREESVGKVGATGQIVQLSIGKAGPTGRGSKTLNLASPGVKGKPFTFSLFGIELS